MKRASLIAVSFLLTLACDGDKTLTPPPTPFVPPVTSVSVSLSPLVQTIPPGQTARLIATARYSDGSTKDVTSQATWTSTDARVATVSSGAVTGVALGSVVIRANFERWSTFMTIVIEPDGTFILSGKVTEAGGVVVGGATVEVISGTPNQTITNSGGSYRLFGIGGTSILRFGKTGYFDERRSVTMSADQSLDVEITPRSAPASVAGTYRVTFTASASCTILAAELKTRTYTARIDQDAARLLVTLSGASFVTMKNSFSGKVFGNTVTFDMGEGGYYYYYYGAPVQEVLPGGQILGIFGTMTASATPQSISGTLAGGFGLQTGRARTSCAANDHQVVFTRQ
jgi:Carboxypeptidase regulatory-like domain/Bacterial Ig-like domain (group 2)